jgi:subtilisin family serine protease
VSPNVIVAVIDSGVHPDHPHIDAARILTGCAIASDGSLLEDGAIPLDRLGHGTAVTAAIQEKAPEAQILPIRVFHEALRGSAMALITAIDAATLRGAKIINLSLGTTNAAHAPLFEAALAHAATQGALVIAASEADGIPCLPGSLANSLSGVIGVGLDWDIPRKAYRWDGSRIIASGYPRPIEGVAPRRNIYGISFAVAQASGFAARAALALGPAATPATIIRYLAEHAA